MHCFHLPLNIQMLQSILFFSYTIPPKIFTAAVSVRTTESSRGGREWETIQKGGEADVEKEKQDSALSDSDVNS